MTFPNIITIGLIIGLFIGLCVFVVFAFRRINELYKFLLRQPQEQGEQPRVQSEQSREQSKQTQGQSEQSEVQNEQLQEQGRQTQVQSEQSQKQDKQTQGQSEQSQGQSLNPSGSGKQSSLFDSISSGEVSVWSVLGPLIVFIAIVIIAGIVLILIISQTLPK